MRTLVLILAVAVLAGCSVMPRGVLKAVDRDITLDQVQANPDRYLGSNVLWGGIILGAENLEDVTEIEVLETKLGFDERPANGTSRGRFIIRARGFLDTNIYSKDKRITVAGTVRAVERRRIGRMEYPYPVLEPIEVRISDPVEDRYVYQDPFLYGPFYPYGPYGPFSPFNPYYPFGPRRPYYPYPFFP
ncbi:Slp/YeaY family lipoprotein [bacterium]|nr:Slp/YeaY family lipoprotein [bacterium]